MARQLFKHVVGSVKSEESRRYIEDEVDVYFPEVIRSKPVDKKQGSGPPLGASESVTCRYIFEDTVRHSIDAYKALLGHSVAPELARGVLNQFAMTTWTDTASLYYWSQVYNTRSREDVQEETRMVADMLPGLIEPYFPESWAALTYMKKIRHGWPRRFVIETVTYREVLYPRKTLCKRLLVLSSMQAIVWKHSIEQRL